MKTFYYILILLGLFCFSSCIDNGWKPSCNDTINITPLIEKVDSSADFIIYGHSSSFYPNFDIEYDTVNFEVGNGTLLENIALPYKIENVKIDQTYTVYIRRRCDNGNTSRWFGPFNSYLENSINCEEIHSMYADSSEINYIRIKWNLLGDVYPYYENEIPGFYEIEYGALGFELGLGTRKITSNKYIELENLPPATAFDFYIRSNCGSDKYGQWKGPQSFATEE